MLITNEKIEVTEQMMFNSRLSRMMITGELGVPFAKDKKEPVEWKEMINLTEEDFDKIEQFFLNKIS